MPFLKVERKASGTYLRILESYRNDAGRPTSRVLHSLGKLADYTPDQLRSIGIRLYELGGGQVKALLEGDVEEKARYCYGYAQVYGKAMKHYGLDNMLRRIGGKHKLQFDLYNAVLLMLLERLRDPSSKRSNFCNQLDYAGIEPVGLQHLYRSLDKLADYSNLVQQHIFQTGRDLFNQQLDVVFYDVTTLYFESETEQQGALRQKGFSKDGKIGNTQILFCMMIDRHKQPVGYRIFKGDTFEGHTFEKALEDLKQEFSIDKVIVVADRGMLSKQNIALTAAQGYEFILGERIKSLPAAIQLQLLNRDAYRKEWVYQDHDDKPVRIQYMLIQHEGKSIIATYSEKRATKDHHDREEKLQIAKQLLQQPSLLKKKAARYFLKQQGTDKYCLDEEKIARQEKYDGILAITTNNTTLSVTEVLENYKQLYKIEHTFRSFKGHLETRPMFHWTDKRIEGHICLCYIAYTLLNYVLLKVNHRKPVLTEATLRTLLDHMQVSLLQHNDKEVYLRSMPQAAQGALQQAMGLQPLPPLLPTSQLPNYL